jgi:hypothetical protein
MHLQLDPAEAPAAYRYCPTHQVVGTERTCWVGGCVTIAQTCWHVPCNGAQGHPSHTAGSWSAAEAAA